MVFSSIPFLFYFLPITLLFYYVVPRRLRNGMLLLTSLLFYAWGEPVNILLMLISISVNYIFGLILGKLQNSRPTTGATPAEQRFRQDIGREEVGHRPLAARLTLLMSCIFNIGLLFYFKYFSFLLSNLAALTNNDNLLVEITLPIGISFYTFQIMSYIIDLYRGRVGVEKNIINLGAYIAMFPQLIAGPIVRFKSIQEQLRRRRESIMLFRTGCRRFLIGLAKKVIFANQAGEVWKLTESYSDGSLPVLMAWLAVFAFTLQIYFDFSGYSDMAIGLGAMFGFEFEENFNYPYIADSITDFWRRWHISLSTWFKEYVYIPLGGNRCGKLIQIRNIFIVWLLTGLWHGANWNFVIWGLYFALLLLIDKFWFQRFANKIPKILRIVITFILVNIGFAIFAETNLIRLGKLLLAMVGISSQGLYDNATIYYFSSYLFSLLLMLFGATPLLHNVFHMTEDIIMYERGVKMQMFWELLQLLVGIVIFVAVLSCLINDSYNPFLYFRF